MYVVAALYKFTELKDFKELREVLIDLCKSNDIRGSLLLAEEGINGTVAGSSQAIDKLKNWLASDKRFDGVEYKESFSPKCPFYRMKVKLKKEIVTLSVPGVSPVKKVGTYVKPKDWNNLLQDPDVVLIDTRNDYEVKIGTFKGAVDPKTTSFSQFPEFIENNFNPKQHKKVAMFCTGGIRCEKASSYMLEQGFEEVYHLHGGILKYLEEVPQEESLWQGDCFVFDQRVAVNHDLDRGDYEMCFGCRMPISEEDKKSPYYEEGVSCNSCYDQNDESKKRNLRERQKQIAIAKAKGRAHMGFTRKQNVSKALRYKESQQSVC